MYFLNKGYAIIQLPEYLLSLFNYLKKKGKNHLLYGIKANDLNITAQYSTTELNYTKTAKPLVTLKPNDAPTLQERLTSLELSVKNIESKLK